MLALARARNWQPPRERTMAVTLAPATTSVTQALAHFARGDAFANPPEALYTRATRAFIDTIGVSIAGGREDCFNILAKSSGGSPGKATILPTRRQTSAAEAALLNGT